jgi:serine/threonine protein kinase
MSDNLKGKSFGRYHLLEKIGEGGMAVVYKALDTTLQRHVAVKVILPYREHSSKFLARFKREARALARLSHPNILKIFDFGEFDNQPYLVTEYVSGGTLKDWIKGKPISWQKAAQTLAHVARALEAAHAQGIIHRDVKPSNILMANGRDPMLSDFGIAKLIEGDDETADLTGSGVGIGTPDYMAPEQGVGNADERSDIYGLGVIFYQMVTGRLPYEADTPLAVMLKKSTQPMPRPTQYIPSLPTSVENVLIKALAREPANRYTNMGAFAAALEELTYQTDTPSTLDTLDDFDNPLSIETVVEKGSKAFPSWAIAAGIISICCIASIVGIFLWRTISPLSLLPTEASPSPTTFPSLSTETTLPSPAQDSSLASPTTELPSSSTSSGGNWIAFNSRKSGNADIYLIDTNGDNLTQLTTSGAHDFYPSWSPDGKRIVYQTNEGGDQELAIITISNKKVTQLTRNECNDWAPSWSPTGDWIVFYSDCDGERNIYKIRSDGSERTQLTSTSGSYSWFPNWSPNGEQITFSSNRSGKYRIYVMNANGGNVKELAAGCISYFSPDGRQILYGVYCDDTDDLWLMNADGSNQNPITNGQECKNATWSPDGKSIVFQLSQTTKDGPFALYIMSLDKPQKSNWFKLTDYNVNGGSPVWQP